MVITKNLIIFFNYKFNINEPLYIEFGINSHILTQYGIHLTKNLLKPFTYLRIDINILFML